MSDERKAQVVGASLVDSSQEKEADVFLFLNVKLTIHLEGMKSAFVMLVAACLLVPSAASPEDKLSSLVVPWKRLASHFKGDNLRKHEKRELHEGMQEEPLTAEEKEAEAEAEAIEESKTKWGFVIGILALGGTFVGGYILELHHVTRLPEAGVGILIGAGVSFAAIATGNQVISEHEKFDFEFFMTWLLPPIIFEAGYNMNVRACAHAHNSRSIASRKKCSATRLPAFVFLA